ncbi:LOW QUALITY PROTEIN: Helitron helicase [Phytophthora megakarya]|uniref:Helitron helicase n=1 Tax=Phytophthora megakarya TaxID=4795 RepID=A0A225V7E4_9STRA|nr:LOW QUALITY PROTEIN: Helitron helicase [Phytophthora megakarya]
MQSFLAKSKGGTDPKASLIISDEAFMMNRGFYEQRIGSCYTRGDDSCVLYEFRSVRKITSSSSYQNIRYEPPQIQGAADIAKFSEFLLQIGEGRYPVNEDIGEGDMCFPHGMYVFLEPLEVLPVLAERRDADSDSNEDDEMESFPNYNLHPSVDDHTSRDVELMVHDTTPDSSNVPPEADDADNDRRTCDINVLIDVVYSVINADELPNEYFVERTILAPTNASVGRINEIKKSQTGTCSNRMTQDYAMELGFVLFHWQEKY